MKVLVIIPAYNEELNIKKVVSNLIDHYPQYNYVVAKEEMQNFRQLVQPLYRKYCADYLPLVEEIQAE